MNIPKLHYVLPLISLCNNKIGKTKFAVHEAISEEMDILEAHQWQCLTDQKKLEA
jgi:hypothetical protein